MKEKLLVIGGGASGLMAAVTAAHRGCSVTVLEKMPRPARKMMITGKGRCNVTNDCGIDTLVSSTVANGRFLYSAFSSFSPADTKAFFENAGVPLKTERGNRVFPLSDKAVDIVDALVNEAKASGVKILTETVVSVLTEDGTAVGAECESNNTYYADAVIISTGGCSYPLTGSTGDGHGFAKALGHTVTELCPSLVPLVIRDEWCASLQGLSLKNVSVSFYEQGVKKPVYTDFGELMFTHFGVSGPTVLSASTHLRKHRGIGYRMEIDMKPALDDATLDKRLQREFSDNINKDIINSLDALLPKRLIPVIIDKSGVPRNIKCNSVSKAQRDALVRTLKHLSAETCGFRPIEEAVVTAGGVKTSEIDPSTMQSKLIKRLYFTGEVIDVDAYTGGFNLQIAFSTGHLAGSKVFSEE